MKRPIVLIPARRISDPDFQIPVQGNCDSYVESIDKAGGLSLFLPLMAYEPKCLEYLITKVDGVLLSGGEDVSPNRYSEAPHPKLGSVCEIRDSVEQIVFNLAIEHKKPILGICRGIQAVNVFLGGSLYQDISSEIQSAGVHEIGEGCWTATPHSVEIIAGTILADVLGAGIIKVNSIHHQAINRVASALTISARCVEDGLIEAVESEQLKILAVQWHPETMWQHDKEQFMLKLFKGFLELL